MEINDIAMEFNNIAALWKLTTLQPMEINNIAAYGI